MPSLISNTVNFPACSVFDPGPFEASDGTLFTFWADNGKTEIQPYKSEDDGATWAASTTGPTLNSAGTGFSNVVENNSRLASFECVPQNNLIYVAYLNDSAEITISTFNLATEAWNIWATGGPVVVEDASPTRDVAEARLAFCDDGEGGFLFHYHGTVEHTHYARVTSSGVWTTTGVQVSVNVAPDIAPAGNSVRPLNCIRIGRLVHFIYTWRIISERALNLDDMTLSDARYCIADPTLVSWNGGFASQNAVIAWGNARVGGNHITMPIVFSDEGPNRFGIVWATSAFNTTWTLDRPLIFFKSSFGGGPYSTTPLYASFGRGTAPFQTPNLPAPVTIAARPRCFVGHWIDSVHQTIVRARLYRETWDVFDDDRLDPVFTDPGEVASELDFSGSYQPVIAVYSRRINSGLALCYIYRASAGAAHEAYFHLVEDPCPLIRNYVDSAAANNFAC